MVVFVLAEICSLFLFQLYKICNRQICCRTGFTISVQLTYIFYWYGCPVWSYFYTDIGCLQVYSDDTSSTYDSVWFYKGPELLPWGTCFQLLPRLAAYTQRVGQLQVLMKPKRQLSLQTYIVYVKKPISTHEDKGFFLINIADG